MRLRILTLNVRGIADRDKRVALFHLLRTIPADVFCLQEVHAPDDHTLWDMEWGGEARWNKYTAILFPRRLGSTTFDVRLHGRVLSSTFQFRGRFYNLANLYIPATREERIPFLDKLRREHLDHFSSFDLLVGDWNMFPDLQRDRSVPRSGGPPSSFPAYADWAHFAPFVSNFFDAALTGSSPLFYTFHRANPVVHSRIDHVFAHVRHVNLTVNTTPQEYSGTDHTGVLVSFSDSPSKPTPFIVLTPFTFPMTPFNHRPFPFFPLTVPLLTGMLQRLLLGRMLKILLIGLPSSAIRPFVSLNASCLLLTIVPPGTFRMSRWHRPWLIVVSAWTLKSLIRNLVLLSVAVFAGWKKAKHPPTIFSLASDLLIPSPPPLCFGTLPALNFPRQLTVKLLSLSTTLTCMLPLLLTLPHVSLFFRLSAFRKFPLTRFPNSLPLLRLKNWLSRFVTSLCVAPRAQTDFRTNGTRPLPTPLSLSFFPCSTPSCKVLPLLLLGPALSFL